MVAYPERIVAVVDSCNRESWASVATTLGSVTGHAKNAIDVLQSTGLDRRPGVAALMGRG